MNINNLNKLNKLILYIFDNIHKKFGINLHKFKYLILFVLILLFFILCIEIFKKTFSFSNILIIIIVIFIISNYYKKKIEKLKEKK